MNQYLKSPEKTVLVGLSTNEQTRMQAEAYLDELAFLVETAGGTPVKKFIQNLPKPDSKTLVGSGKILEIKEFCKENNIDLVVFDDELGPSQIRNIQNALQCRIIDRNNLILDIFALRARTSYARTQVELAQYQYLLPRLTGMWTHLEKQRGGIGLKGPGEKEIETDRRIIKQRISLLKKKLIEIDKQKTTQRKSRESLIRVALIGYTNAGKSTIMNLLAKSDVFAENKLFATLDTTVRKVVIENLPFLLTDTVGFIRKLPHSLIESFKSTLDEVIEADLLIHVVDISHPAFEEQIQVVNQTLAEIKSEKKPVIMVFNKTDKYQLSENKTESDLQKHFTNSWMQTGNATTVFISAIQKTNLDELKNTIYNNVKSMHAVLYPYNNFLY